MPLVQKKPPWAPSSYAPTLVSPATGPGPSPRVGIDQGWRSFELQPWVTIRANASGPAPWPAVLSVTQDEGGWVDLMRFADAAFWVEVAEVTQPTGGTVQLTIESSPSPDEPLFKPVAQPVNVAPVTDPTTNGTIPLLVRTARTPTTVPLSRWTRWRVSVTPGATGPWDVTFRIRGAGGRSSFVLPNQLSGCLLWLRADLGITQRDAPGSVSNWADQSGNARDASQTAVNLSNQPLCNHTERYINGQATLWFDSTSSKRWMSLASSLGSPSAIHSFVVHRRVSATTTDITLTGFWGIGTSGLQSHMPFTDGKIYDDGGGATRYDCGTPPAAVALNIPQAYEVQNQAGSWRNFLNGRPQFTSLTNTVGSGAASPVIGLSPGTTNVYYDGDIAEYIFYNRILTANERALLINYLNGRYGLGAV
jgi:hypothetical protein